jgi:(2Fe-2S) ferredoxin
MNSEPGSFDLHVFVCTNVKENRESCGPKNSDLLRQELKDWCKLNFGKRVRINSSGCLDRCSQGIAVAIYPKNEWLLGCTTESLEEIKKHITIEMAKKP